jgi:predicted transcriptional regulator
MATTDLAMDTRRIHDLLLRTLRFGPKSFWELMRAGKAQTHQILEALQELMKHELVACEEDRFVLTEASFGTSRKSWPCAPKPHPTSTRVT